MKSLAVETLLVALLLANAIPALGFGRWFLAAGLCVPLSATGRAPQNDSAAAQAVTGGQHFDQEQALAALARQIAGSENKPAREVFKNIILTQFQGMPAGRLPLVMTAFSRALGTDCTHCHEPGAWEKEDKPEKQVAREMFKMVLAINNDYLQNIKNLKSTTPVVSCTTCHRGQLKPEVNLPEPRPGAKQ